MDDTVTLVLTVDQAAAVELALRQRATSLLDDANRYVAEGETGPDSLAAAFYQSARWYDAIADSVGQEVAPLLLRRSTARTAAGQPPRRWGSNPAAG